MSLSGVSFYEPPIGSTSSKVSEIFMTAGTAFQRLGELALHLNASIEHNVEAKWTPRELDLLQDAVDRFAEDLCKITDQVKTKTVQQLRSGMKRKALDDAGFHAPTPFRYRGGGGGGFRGAPMNRRGGGGGMATIRSGSPPAVRRRAPRGYSTMMNMEPTFVCTPQSNLEYQQAPSPIPQAIPVNNAQASRGYLNQSVRGSSAANRSGMKGRVPSQGMTGRGGSGSRFGMRYPSSGNARSNGDIEQDEYEMEGYEDEEQFGDYYEQDDGDYFE